LFGKICYCKEDNVWKQDILEIRDNIIIIFHKRDTQSYFHRVYVRTRILDRSCMDIKLLFLFYIDGMFSVAFRNFKIDFVMFDEITKLILLQIKIKILILMRITFGKVEPNLH